MESPNMQTYSVIKFIAHPCLFFQSRPILISCQSPATLIKSTSLFQFVASNLCKQAGVYLQSAASALKSKLQLLYLFIYIYFFKSWISCLISMEAGLHLKSRPLTGRRRSQIWGIRRTERAAHHKTFHASHSSIGSGIIVICASYSAWTFCGECFSWRGWEAACAGGDCPVKLSHRR